MSFKIHGSSGLTFPHADGTVRPRFRPLFVQTMKGENMDTARSDRALIPLSGLLDAVTSHTQQQLPYAEWFDPCGGLEMPVTSEEVIDALLRIFVTAGGRDSDFLISASARTVDDVAQLVFLTAQAIATEGCDRAIAPGKSLLYVLRMLDVQLIRSIDNKTWGFLRIDTLMALLAQRSREDLTPDELAVLVDKARAANDEAIRRRGSGCFQFFPSTIRQARFELGRLPEDQGREVQNAFHEHAERTGSFLMSDEDFEWYLQKASERR